MTRRLRHFAVPLFLLLCLLLGGSGQGVWRNLALQLCGLALIGWALLARSRSLPTAAARALPVFAGLWLLLLVVQLVPLPPGLWSQFPGRGIVVESFALRGQPLPWLPLSLAPAATAAALPAIAVFAGMVAALVWLGAYRARWVIGALMAGTFVSVTLGALQLVQGGPYLYPIANFGAAAGLFANSNHQATLLLATIPFLAAAVGRELGRGKTRSSKGLSRILIASGALAVVLVGLALNGSMAALLLVVPVTLASLAIAVPRMSRFGGSLAGVAVVILLAAIAAIALISDPSSASTSLSSRTDIYARTLQAIADTMPMGTGIGTFESYYPLYEDPGAADAFYVNHAHSDPLEWLLETGLAGGLLMLAFLLWWMRQSIRIWAHEQREPMALAGTIASAAILAHSLVDFPLRTSAIQAVFAISLAFMVEPRSHSTRRQRDDGRRSVRHLSLDDDDAAVSE